jgi:poly(3-hydroxybutyrate) depolymerase
MCSLRTPRVSSNLQSVRFMIYQAYQAHADALAPFRFMAGETLGLLASSQSAFVPDSAWSRNVMAACEIIASAGLTHKRPPFGIDSVTVGNRQVEVREESAARTPFCTLLHLKKDVEVAQPRVLLVAPMSGHFATLLRDTVRTMLRDHDVYITDWHNARDIPLRDGRFDFEDFIGHLIGFLETIGPGAHLVAICQPSVAALAATAIMAEDNNPARPRSMTLMAGPIDTRINPTKVNEFATSRSLEWFERNVIDTVPFRHAGAFRPVYPGFIQLLAFMSMNIDRHMKSFHELYRNRVKADSAKVEMVRKFYAEYFAVMDLTAEFFLQTIRDVFQEYALPLGRMTWRGRRIDLGAIRRTPLLTVEGEKDDVCAVGQTLAAHDLCVNLRPYLKKHYVQTNVGHYGVFAGRLWVNQIYPIVRDLIHASD